MIGKNYRHHQQILADVLLITQDANRNGVGVTKLCTKSNISHGRLRSLLSTLTGSGLINQIRFDGRNTFVITEKGSQYLEQYKKFSEIAESMGLEM